MRRPTALAAGRPRRRDRDGDWRSRRGAGTVLLGLALLLGIGILLGQVGLLRFPGPELPEFTALEVEVSLPDEARIIAVEPITLDCRARVHAQVPDEGARRHRALGQVYAYAQNVIGSSNCMKTAYTVTEGILLHAYRQQFVKQGVDPAKLTVRIEGDPLFGDPEDIEMGDDVTLSVGGGEVVCVASDDLGGLSTPSDV